MFKLIMAICLSCLFLQASGQEVKVKLSSDIVVIKGRSYYMHTVLPGQTLYSICRAYGVTTAEVMAMNGRKDTSLRPDEILKIPYREPFVQKDARYFYHRVKAGETLYSIGRTYGIKVRKITRYNRKYAGSPLETGCVLRLPLDGIDPAIAASGIQPSTQDRTKVREEAPQEETAAAQDRESADGKTTVAVPVPADTAAGRPHVPDSFNAEFTRVALLLPFSARHYPPFNDTLDIPGQVSISPRTAQFIDFYQGILLAADSLRRTGRKIDLHVFDTERDVRRTSLIAQQIDSLHPHLVIGPVYGSTCRVLAERLTDRNIPLVYPLSSRSEGLERYPNFIQLNPSPMSVVRYMTEWLVGQNDSCQVIHIQLAGETGSHKAEKQFLKERLEASGILSFRWNPDNLPLESLKASLDPDRENILVLPLEREADVIKLLPPLTALAEEFPITAVGLPEWQAFNSVDHETFFKLNTKIFVHSYVDHSSSEALALAAESHRYFCHEPGNLFYKAFDLGIFFMGMAADCRERTLDMLDFQDASVNLSRFRFRPGPTGSRENQGFFIVNYGSDFRLKISRPHYSR